MTDSECFRIISKVWGLQRLDKRIDPKRLEFKFPKDVCCKQTQYCTKTVQSNHTKHQEVVWLAPREAVSTLSWTKDCLLELSENSYSICSGLPRRHIIPNFWWNVFQLLAHCRAQIIPLHLLQQLQDFSWPHRKLKTANSDHSLL
jgi:hypothetical protein